MIRDVFEDFEVNEPCDLENQEFFAYDADLEYGGIYEKIPLIQNLSKIGNKHVPTTHNNNNNSLKDETGMRLLIFYISNEQ